MFGLELLLRGHKVTISRSLHIRHTMIAPSRQGQQPRVGHAHHLDHPIRVAVMLGSPLPGNPTGAYDRSDRQDSR